ncbi:MAG TPA: hypothetical protein VFI31_04200, partial [Pirellulales bacterium]|nr:hypothetical protein [Pirellulales bacterium]
TASEKSVVPKGVLIGLASGAVLLPVAITLVLATGFLFAGLQDTGAARVLNGVGLALGLTWAIDLIALVIMLGFDAARRAELDPKEPDEGE